MMVVREVRGRWKRSFEEKAGPCDRVGVVGATRVW